MHASVAKAQKDFLSLYRVKNTLLTLIMMKRKWLFGTQPRRVSFTSHLCVRSRLVGSAGSDEKEESPGEMRRKKKKEREKGALAPFLLPTKPLLNFSSSSSSLSLPCNPGREREGRGDSARRDPQPKPGQQGRKGGFPLFYFTVRPREPLACLG